MTMVSPDDGTPSISRTTRYKKVTKPLLERKRRARINRCLDELKDLMVGAFEVEGDNISKLEKADILELTVRHLTKLHSPRDPIADAKRFQAGFGQCAAEACQYILSMPEIDQQISQNLIRHLNSQLPEVPLSVQVPTRQTFSPPVSPASRSARLSPRESIRSLPGSRASSPSAYNRPNPVNYPLTCDTVSINSTPSMYDLDKPMTGLLMTVDNDPRTNDRPTSSTRSSNHSEESRRRHNAEVKHVIMKKIREQILGRQVREAEPKEYQSYRGETSEHNHRHQNRYENVNVYEQGCSVDLRKRSKGEAKHYSPRFEQASFYQQYPEDVSHPEPVNPNYNSAEHNDEPKAPTTSDHQPIDYSNADLYSWRKRHADYRNIHPKKALIRPISDAEVTSSRNDHQRTVAERGDHAAQPSLRLQRFSNNKQMIYGPRNNPPAPYNLSNHPVRYSPNEHYQREPGRPGYQLPDNEQEENMWRPW